MLFRMGNVKDIVLKSQFILELLLNTFMELKLALKVFNFP